MGDVRGAPSRAWFRAESGAQVAAGLLTFAVLALGGAILLFYSRRYLPAPVPVSIDPADAAFYGPQQAISHLSHEMSFFDSRGQSLAHLAMVVAVALLGATIIGLGWGRGLGRSRGTRLALEVGLGVLTAGLLAQAVAETRPLVLLIGLPVFFLLYRFGRHLLRGDGNAAFRAAAWAVLAAAVLPAFLQRLDLSSRSWSKIVFYQYHYSVVLGASDQLAAGRRLFEDVFPNYGAALPVATAAVQRLAGTWSMGDYLRFLQALQAVYLLLAAWLYHRHARGRWAFALPALLLVVPWYHFGHRGLLFPNQSPWRAIAVPLVAGVLLLLARRGRPLTAVALGAAGAAALLLNFETGIALGAGLGAYLFFRHGPRPALGLARLAVLALLGAGAAMALFLLGYRLALGHALDLSRVLDLGGRAGVLAASGWNGLHLTAVAWPAVIFGHAVFVLLHTALHMRPPAPLGACFRVFVATTLVVWFAYYAYRPSEWGLSSYYLLYGFLVIDALRYFVREVAVRRRWNPLVAFGLAAALLLGLPRLCVTNALAVRHAGRAVLASLHAETEEPSREVSGLYLPRNGADEVLAKARYLRAAAAVGAPLYFTSDLYLVPKLSGVLSGGLPLGMDLEMITRDDYERMLDEVIASPRRRIFFDAPGTEAARARLLGSLLRQMRADLSGYFEPVGVEAGWEIWRRTRPGPREPSTRASSTP